MVNIEILQVPVNLGSIENSHSTINRRLLAKIEDSLKSAPNNQLFVWVYCSSENILPKLKAKLLERLSETGIDRSRFTIVGSSKKKRGATFWLIPPSAPNPEP